MIGEDLLSFRVTRIRGTETTTVNGTFFRPNYFSGFTRTDAGSSLTGMFVQCCPSGRVDVGHCVLSWIDNVPVVSFVQIPMIETFSVELLGGSVTTAPVL